MASSLRRLFVSAHTCSKRRRRRAQNSLASLSPWRRPRLEALEARQLLTAYIVENLDDTNAADGQISLREAIMAANTNTAVVDAPAGEAGPGAVDSITFAAGLSGQTIFLSDFGPLTITDNLIIQDNNATPITINGGGMRQLIIVGDGARNVSISDVTLTGGNTLGAAVDRGGALFVDAGEELSLTNVAINGNASGDGGGIYNDGGTLTLTNVQVTNNLATAPSGSGGGLFNNNGMVTISASTFSGNSANRAGGAIETDGGSVAIEDTDLVDNDVNGGTGGAANPGNGGALHITGASLVFISNGTVENNTAASEGGGLWNSATGTLTVEGTMISGNTALGNDADQGGGGIFNDGGEVTVTGATITQNTASGTSGSGGGILNNTGGTLNIINSTISANTANRAGGGIEDNAGTSTVLQNVNLNGNSTGPNPGNGGGLHITGAGSVTINGGTVEDNTATSEGGGLWNSATGTLTVEGTLISGNTAQGNDADQGGGGIFNDGGQVTITGAVITQNTASGTSGSGGGILNNVGGTIDITGSTISANTANRAGGGIEDNAGSSIMLQNTLLNGNSTGPNPGNGGGLHITGAGTVTIHGGTVEDNLATSEGGGLWNSATGTLTVEGTLISGNTAQGNDADQGGGGIFNDGGQVTISGATITQNTANGTAGSGGGILNNTGGTIDITNSTMSANTAIRAGGGIEDNAGSSIVLQNVDLNGNSTGASPGNGGGLHITGAGSVTLRDSTVRDNTASNEGGGLWGSGAGSLVVERTTVSGNMAPDGGGLFLQAGTGALDVTNSTVSNNSATNGGGIQVEGGTLTLLNATVASNTASNMGGGINNAGGSVDAANTIIGDNTAPVGPDFSGGFSSAISTLLESASGASGISGDTNGNLVGVDALLGPLSDNGGPTLTHLPAMGSPAIDAGDNAAASGLNTDQRGLSRIASVAIDIGAVERQALGQDFEVSFENSSSELTVARQGDSLIVTNRFGAVVVQQPLSAVNSLTFIGQSRRRDTLTVDFGGGDLPLAGGIVFVESAVRHSDHNVLRILGGPANDADDEVTIAEGLITANGLEIQVGGLGLVKAQLGDGDDRINIGTDAYDVDVHDTGGEDTLDFSESSNGLYLSLGHGRGRLGWADIDIKGDIETIYGTEQSDRIIAGHAMVTVYALAGSDSLSAYSAPVYFDGGAGVDWIRGSYKDDTLIGGSESDFIWGRGGDDMLDGGDGHDFLFGGSGDDYLQGNRGSDYLDAGWGSDILLGGNGRDQLRGAGGRDLLLGGLGFDRLSGGSDDDILFGATTVYDMNEAALRDLLNAWNQRSDIDTRIAQIAAAFSTSELQDDLQRDVLTGDWDDDWLLAFTSDSVQQVRSNDRVQPL